MGALGSKKWRTRRLHPAPHRWDQTLLTIARDAELLLDELGRGQRSDRRLEALRHAVERGLKLADLVLATNGDSDTEIAGLHPRRGTADPIHRRAQPNDHEQRHDPGDGEDVEEQKSRYHEQQRRRRVDFG